MEKKMSDNYALEIKYDGPSPDFTKHETWVFDIATGWHPIGETITVIYCEEGKEVARGEFVRSGANTLERKAE